MRRQRIGIVSTWFERGAAYVSRAYRDVLAPHFDVKVYARGGEYQARNDPLWDDPDVTWFQSVVHKRTGTVRVDRRHFRDWIKSNSLQCVIFNEEHDWQLVNDSKEQGVATGSYIDYYTPSTVDLFSAFDFLLCNTKRHQTVFAWHPGCYYIPWGTDCSVFRPIDVNGIKKGPVRFFHSAGMGGVNLRKGTDLVVEAFREVHGPAELIIHSQAPIGNYGAAAETIREDKRITFIHETVAAPGLYGLGDVYVYPGRLDGIGLSLPEALASGLPVVASDTDPYRDFITDGVNGWLIPIAKTAPRSDGYYWPEVECNVDLLRVRLQWLVENPDQVTQYKSRARSSAETYLNWETNSAGLPSIIEKWCHLSELRRSRSVATALDEQIFRFRHRNIAERLARRVRRLSQPK